MASIVGILLMAAMVAGPPASLTQGKGRFAYTLEKTPEQGPVDPVVAGRYSAAWHGCTEGEVATPDLAPCYEREFGRQDAALNRSWHETLRRVPASERLALVDAQRAWAAARDPFCRGAVTGLRGALVSIAYLDCRVEVTIRRTIWLQRL